MSDNVGIIRTETNLQKALIKILELKSAAPKVGVRGDLKYNKGLLACLEIPNMLTAAEAVVRGAMTRKESRGAHARSDYPKKDPNFKKNIIYKKSGDEMKLELRPVPEMPENLKKLVDPEEY